MQALYGQHVDSTPEMLTVIKAKYIGTTYMGAFMALARDKTPNGSHLG